MANSCGLELTYDSIPTHSLNAFKILADLAYENEEEEKIALAIAGFKDLHDNVLMHWCRVLTNETVLYELRMTMKIIRMELSRLREKLTVAPS